MIVNYVLQDDGVMIYMIYITMKQIVGEGREMSWNEPRGEDPHHGRLASVLKLEQTLSKTKRKLNIHVNI